MADQAKVAEVTALLNKLREDLVKKSLSVTEKQKTFESLKILGRSVQNAAPIFTKDGIEVLGRHGLDASPSAASREALKCLANALFLESKTRQIFVDLGFAEKAADRLKCDNLDDQFLLSRLLFYTTYDTNLDFDRLIDQHKLAININQNITRIAKHFSKKKHKLPLAPQEEMALSESLKLIFNISHYYPDRTGCFTSSIPEILKILLRLKLPTPPMDPPVNFLVNALINLDLEDKAGQAVGSSLLFPKFDTKCNAEMLINLLDEAIVVYRGEQRDVLAAPLVTLIRRVHDCAPDGVKRYMQWLLLPSDEERAKPLGKSDTLASRLLRLSSESTSPPMRESISSLMFELSGKDASSFVKNVGYGFASGFLVSHNVPIPENAMEAWSTQGQDSSKESGKSSQEAFINPITGQRLDKEAKDTGPPMTDEEKEREAERLFVLFERLKKTGVVNVKNPVEQAVDEGRFEELD
ncbi:hypothetical protein L228DRAFT_257649 [Xylona heveae TC161]|uniref:Guanine nucleotide exchange factor n=1 Tax=Xylona heveae (strain CBS 132557 / TC161) TaxID=1328760 RepID=A0A165JFG5_XYLHT|nr:hypothetical protein L228DRAFT_257649 [Xylona heveae TC161]KZF26167.1 hypothetical protein L228DRAFT_257649 [Xylona heveae TC161]